jgi:succinate dehydrogenase/fumarate reductase cytochrome b subunit
MTEPRSIPVIDERSKSTTEPVAQARPFVERCLSWSGLAPLPAFLILHLASEFRQAFAEDVGEVVREPRGIPRAALVAILVWAPLALHLVLGGGKLVFGWPGAAHAEAKPRDAWRSVSKACAALSAVFVLYHLRRYPFAVWLGEADPRDAGFRILAELSSTRFGVPLGGAIYLLGLAATSAHLGIAGHRALEGEGLLHGPAERKLSARAWALLGSALFGVGAALVIRVASGVLLR